MKSPKKTNQRSFIQWFMNSKMSFFMTVLPSLLTLITATALIIYLGEKDRRANLLESQMFKTKSIASRVKEKIVIQIHDSRYKRRVISSQNPSDFGFQKFPEEGDVFIFSAKPDHAPFFADTQKIPTLAFMHRDDKKQLVISELPEDLGFEFDEDTHLFGDRNFKIPSRVDANQNLSRDDQSIREALESNVREGTYGIAEHESFKIISFLEVEGTNITVVTQQVLRDHFAYYQTPLLILFLTFSVILIFAFIMQKIIQSKLNSSSQLRAVD